MSTRKNGPRRRRRRPEDGGSPPPTAQPAPITPPEPSPQPESQRKVAFRQVNEVVKTLDSTTDPAGIGQADVEYLIFRAANAPGAAFQGRMRTIAALALLGLEYFNSGFVRYEGHLTQDPELDMLQDAFPGAPRALLHEKRPEFLAALRRMQQEPQPTPNLPPDPPRVFVPEDDERPDPRITDPPRRSDESPWAPSIIQFSPGL